VKLASTLLNIIACLLLATSATASSAPDVDAIARRVDDHYNHLRTMEAQFTELYRGAGIDRTESGTLWLKKPGKMRWQYRSPREKLFLSDGKNTWFYVPGDQQVRRAPLKDLEDMRSPLAFLLGKTRLEKELKGLSLAPDVAPIRSEDEVLRGVPKAMTDQVSQVLLEVSPGGQIVRIVLEGTDGSVTEYRFSDQRENGQVADSQFRFVPPPGVEVIEGNVGQ
jgi:outer membrane lipoprotein carrier protein